MMDLSPEFTTVLMLGGMLIGVLMGFPLAFPVGAVTLYVGYLVFGSNVFNLIYSRIFAILHNYIFLAAPLFIFMGFIMEKCRITDRLFEALNVWIGGMRGGLAIVVVVMGIVLAVCVGVIGASVTMLSVVALTPMVKQGYSKSLACGVVCAAGTLGILIPPSIMLVLYGPMAALSVGKLFMGAFFPGLLLGCLYMIYVALHAWLNPQSAPSTIKAGVTRGMKQVWALIVALVPPAFIALAVLGSIFLGIAPPTEAAAVGAIAVIVLAIIRRTLSLKLLAEASRDTFRITAMILLIGGASYAFVGVFIGAGCGEVIRDLILAAPAGRWGAFAVIMFIVFILGFFMDWIGIVFIIIPVISPMAPEMGFDPIWFALMVCVNLQMAFMTPPLAPAIFYLKGSAPQELGINISDIIRGVVPFVVCIIVGLALCTAFPDIIIWLPNKMIK